MKTFKSSIITPEGLLFETQATAVGLPTPSGRVTILAGHEAYLTRLTLGLIFSRDEGLVESHFLVAGGFAKIKDDELLILCQTVFDEEEDLEKQIQKAIENAALEKVEVLSAEQQALLEARLRRGLKDLSLKNQTKRHSHNQTNS